MEKILSVVLKMVDRFTGPLRRIVGRVTGFGRMLKSRMNMERFTGGLQRMRRGLLVGATALAGYGAAAYLVGRQLLGPATMFENFHTQLVTSTGSAARAKKAMSWITDFAVKTPYELDQVTSAFVKLRPFMDPKTGVLTDLGDWASGMGKSLDDAVEALKDALTGENERLKELGITARKVGKYFEYSFGDFKVRAVAGNQKAVTAALRQIMQVKFGGGMERMSKTFDGILGNLKDMWLKFKLMIMEEGLFDWMKSKLQLLLDTINKMEASGKLRRWARVIGENIQYGLKALWRFGKDVVAWFREVGPRINKVVGFLGGWKMVIGGILALPFVAALTQIAAGFVMILAALAPIAVPLAGVLLAVAAIAGIGYLIYRNWYPIQAFFVGFWQGLKEGLEPVLPRLEWLGDLFAFLWKVSPLRLFVVAIQEVWQWLTDLASPAEDASEAALAMGRSWGLALGGIVTGLVGMYDRFVAIIDGTIGAFANMFNSLIDNGKRKATELGLSVVTGIMTLIDELPAKMLSAGKAMMMALVDGIKAAASAPIDAITDMVQTIRDKLPFSPAKEGPLKDLDRVRIAETIAQTIKPGPVIAAMNKLARAAAIAVPAAVLPAAAQAATVPVPDNFAAAAAAGRAGALPSPADPAAAQVSIVFSPQITIQGNGDEARIRAVLGDQARELTDMIVRELDRRKRVDF